MYANGEAVVQNEETAQQYYAQALDGFLKLEGSDRADDNLLYKLGRMYRYGLGADEDIQKALEYFSRSAKHGNINAKRMIAIKQLSGEYLPQDVNKAVETLTELAENGDAMSAYRLGKLYLFGTDGIERDVPQAIQWLSKSAEAGNEYAQQLLDNIEQRENTIFASTIFGLFVSLSHAIEDDYNKNHKKLQSKVDGKIQRMIRKHKQELGIREEHDMTM
jgi:TPR repeat protein